MQAGFVPSIAGIRPVTSQSTRSPLYAEPTQTAGQRSPKPPQVQFGSMLLLAAAGVVGATVWGGFAMQDRRARKRAQQQAQSSVAPPNPQEQQAVKQFQAEYDLLPVQDRQARMEKLRDAKISQIDELRLFSLTALETLQLSSNLKRQWAQDMLNDRSESVREKAKDLLIHLPIDRPNL